MNQNDKISQGVRMLKEQGHQVEGRIQFDKMWWEIDRRMLATPEEIEHLADGVYTLADLEDLYIRRRSEERTKKD
jgi:hypothetical protein